MAENLDIQVKINNYVASHPKMSGKSDAVILSAMKEEGLVTQAEIDAAKTTSAFGFGFNKTGDVGLVIESTIPDKSEMHQIPVRQQQLPKGEAQSQCIEVLSESIKNAQMCLDNLNYGVINSLYDKYKESKDSEYTTFKLKQEISDEKSSLYFLQISNFGELTKKEYYEKNKERLRDMLVDHVNYFGSTGELEIDKKYHQGYDLTKVIEEYIQNKIDSINSFEHIKGMQLEILRMDKNQSIDFANKLANEALEWKQQTALKDTAPLRPIKYTPIEYNSTEAISFEEVYKLECGQEFSPRMIESYMVSEAKLQIVETQNNKLYAISQIISGINAYDDIKNTNEKVADSLEFLMNPMDRYINRQNKRNEHLPEKLNDFSELLTNYFTMNPMLAKKEIGQLILENELPMTVVVDNEGNVRVGVEKPDALENSNYLSKLMEKFEEQQKAKFDKLVESMGGFERMTYAYKDAYNNILGYHRAENMSKILESDDLSSTLVEICGGATTAGMIMTVGGAILCFVPGAQGAGASLVSIGGKLVIGGMVAQSAVGYTEALTRGTTDPDELTRLNKEAAMNIGGFVIGGAAGKVATKLFCRTISNELSAAFSQQINNGKPGEALKIIFKNPEYLGQVTKATGLKLGTDFVISYAGDLAMMGILDTNDTWETLLKANLIGVVVGSANEISAVTTKNFSKTAGIKSNTAENSGITARDIEVKPDEVRVDNDLLEGGIKATELDEVAPFARHLVESDEIASERIRIEKLEEDLKLKMADTESVEERQIIRDIIDKTTSENKDLVDMMVKDENISNELALKILNSMDKIPDKFTTRSLLSILSQILLKNPQKFEVKDPLKQKYAKILVEDKNIPRETIPRILEHLQKGNSHLLDMVLNGKNRDFTNIVDILRSTLIENDYNHFRYETSNKKASFAEYLLNKSDFPNQYIAEITYLCGRIHVDFKFVKQLCDNPDFPKSEIRPLLEKIQQNKVGNTHEIYSLEANFKNELAQKLVADNNCPNELVSDIIGSISKNQKELFEEIYADKNIPKSEIAGILYLDYGLNKGINKLEFAEKIDLLIKSVSLSEKTLIYLEKYGFNKAKIDELVNKISLEMGINGKYIKTSEASKQLLFRNYIANNANVENIISRLDLNKLKDGIPLKYSRAEFISDIQNILKDLSKQEQEEILSHFGIQLKDGKMEGFPIIPEAQGHFNDAQLSAIEKLTKKINDFTLNNETTISDPEIKQLFDSLIKGCPEFATVMGKIQHGTHQYTVDVHTLKVLQEAFRNTDYQRLDDESKTVLKFAILLHDLGKAEGVKDPGHYEASAKYAVSILNKYNLPDRVKSRIIETIYNHHWFEDYNKGDIGPEMVNAIYRSPRDLDVAIIMGKADLMGVSDKFHLKVTKTRTPERFEEFWQKRIQVLREYEAMRYSKSNLVMDTKFQQTEDHRFPTREVEIDGVKHTLQVLNLMDDNTSYDLSEYGFAPGTTKDNARFFVHFNDRIKGLRVTMALSSSPITESVQSFSLISKENSRSYKHQIYGIVADVDMKNIAQATYENIASGKKKTLKDFSKDLFGIMQTNTFVRDCLIDELGKTSINLSKEEYAQLAEKIVDIQFSTQVTKDIQIGNKTIPADVLQRALEAARDRLFDGDSHSEIVAINPRVKALVARVSSIEECSPEFLKLAEENNLPIILIGHKDKSGVRTPSKARTTGNVEETKPETLNTEIAESEVKSSGSAPKVEIKPELSIERNTVKGYNYGSLSVSDKSGNTLGNVNYDLREVNGQKALHFEGLVSNESGKGIGTKLINELIEVSKDMGAEGRLIATASPMMSKDGKMTNLEFYYKLGFRATDKAIDAQIQECIKTGKEIPLSLNIFTEIEYSPKTSEVKPVVSEATVKTTAPEENLTTQKTTEKLEYTNKDGEKKEFTLERQYETQLNENGTSVDITYTVRTDNGTEVGNWTGTVYISETESYIQGKWIHSNLSGVNTKGLGTKLKDLIKLEAEKYNCSEIRVVAGLESHTFHNKMGYKCDITDAHINMILDLLKVVKKKGECPDFNERIDKVIETKDKQEINLLLDDILTYANNNELTSRDLGIFHINIPMKYILDTAVEPTAQEASNITVKPEDDSVVKSDDYFEDDFPDVFEGSQVPMHHNLNALNTTYREAYLVATSGKPVSAEDMSELTTGLPKMLEIDREFAKLPPLEKNIVVWRGRFEHPVIERFNDDFRIIDNAEVGDIIIPDVAYSYAAFERKLASNWSSSCGGRTMMFKIRLPKGAKVSRNLEHGGEVVIPRDAEYRLLSKTIKDDHIEVELEYILPENDNVAEIETLMKRHNIEAEKAKSEVEVKPEDVRVETLKPEVANKPVASEAPAADKNSGQNFKVERNTAEGYNYGSLSVSDNSGNTLGNVNYDLREVNGQKALHFEGLVSNESGKGIGTKLINELIEVSKDMGAEGRLIATASPMMSKDGKMTNLEFYYKLGFRAPDKAIDAQIQECIKTGKEIPLSLNVFTEIEYSPKNKKEYKTPVVDGNAKISADDLMSSDIAPKPSAKQNSAEPKIQVPSDTPTQVANFLDKYDILNKNLQELIPLAEGEVDSSTHGHLTSMYELLLKTDDMTYTFVLNFNDKIVAFEAKGPEESSINYFGVKNNNIKKIDIDEYTEFKKITMGDYQYTANLLIKGIDQSLKHQPTINDLMNIFDNPNINFEGSINGTIYYGIGSLKYEIALDSSGKIRSYVKKHQSSYSALECYIYNANGQRENMPPNYTITSAEIPSLKEVLSFGSTHIDLNTLIKYNGNALNSRFNSATVKELHSLVRNADDSKILNALLKDKKFKMPIDSGLNLSSPREYTYSCDDILNILKSDKAKTFILEKINSGRSFSKSDLIKLDKDLLIKPSSYKLETQRNLSYKIEDLQLADKSGKAMDEAAINKYFEENSELKQKVPSGEVVNINGHLYVNDEGHLTKLGLSKEKFEKLFPIEKRHKIKQGPTLGDCWLITSMGALMDSPKGRVAIYKMFSQDGNDILVKFPEAEESIRFRNGKLNNLLPVSVWVEKDQANIGLGTSHVDASKGIQMLEQAYSIHRNDGYKDANIKDKDIQDIFFMNKQMQRLKGGLESDAITNIVGKNNVRVTEINGYIIDNPEKEYLRLVEEFINKPNTIIAFGTKNTYTGNGTNKKYDLVSGHAYHIVGYDKEKGVLSISNPWHNNEIKQIPVYDWLNYITHICAIEIL